jgi:hypothetical protein
MSLEEYLAVLATMLCPQEFCAVPTGITGCLRRNIVLSPQEQLDAALNPRILSRLHSSVLDP